METVCISKIDGIYYVYFDDCASHLHGFDTGNGVPFARWGCKNSILYVGRPYKSYSGAYKKARKAVEKLIVKYGGNWEMYYSGIVEF